MTLKKLALLSVLLGCGSMAQAAEGIITLDLSKAQTPLEFNAANGSWADIYNDDVYTLDSQIFCMLHNSMADYQTWWGFTASNSANNQPNSDYIANQFSAMAKGGIALDEKGDIKLNPQGAPEVSAAMPYAVGYYNAYMGKRPLDMVFSDGEAHQAVGCYVNLTTWAYYTILFGDAFCRQFTEGDKFTLKINGVHADNTEASVEVSLASYTGGRLTAATGWTYVDLTSLGAVNELYFTMSSTDSGVYGMNTPGYFCLDKLQVQAGSSSVAEVNGEGKKLAYDAAGQRVLGAQGAFVALYNAAGQLVASSENGQLSLENLEPAVYVARSGAHTLKVMKR